MLNCITMVGRLVADPELRKTNSGTDVGSFRLACDDRPGPNGEKQAVFINCSVFGKGAEILGKFFAKGNLIGVVGRLTQRKYTNKDNVEVTSTEILVNQIEFVESTKDREASQAAAQGQQVAVKSNVADIDFEDSSLPF